MKYCTCMFCVIIYEQRSLYLNISTNIAPPASCAWPWWCDCHSTLAAKLGLSQLQSRHSWKLWSHLRTENIARTSLSLKFAFQHVFLLTRVSTPGEDDVDRTFRCLGCPLSSFGAWSVVLLWWCVWAGEVTGDMTDRMTIAGVGAAGPGLAQLMSPPGLSPPPTMHSHKHHWPRVWGATPAPALSHPWTRPVAALRKLSVWC